MRRKKRRSSNDFLWVLIILLIICLGVLGRQEYKIYQINKEMSATQQRVDEFKKKFQAELEAERKRLDDLKYIEKLAREDHNMVGKNEVPLFIVDEQEKQQKQETEAEEKKK